LITDMRSHETLFTFNKHFCYLALTACSSLPLLQLFCSAIAQLRAFQISILITFVNTFSFNYH
jgi:hypothetical protein